MSSFASQSGLDYLWSYPGVMKLVEGALNVTLITLVSLIGSDLKSSLLNGVAIYALISVILLLIFHVRGAVKHADLPWFWIECFNCAILVILFSITSSVVVAELTKGYIITGIIGYVISLVYFLDAIDQYKMASLPRARYVWTTPNMPELS